MNVAEHLNVTKISTDPVKTLRTLYNIATRKQVLLQNLTYYSVYTTDEIRHCLYINSADQSADLHMNRLSLLNPIPHYY